MEEKNSQGFSSRYPKTYLTATTTGLVSLCNLITNETYKKICITISPAVTLASAWVFSMCKNYCYNMIEYKRGVKAYKTIIANLNEKLSSGGLNLTESAKVKKQIEKFEEDLHNLEIKNIKVFV